MCVFASVVLCDHINLQHICTHTNETCQQSIKNSIYLIIIRKRLRQYLHRMLIDQHTHTHTRFVLKRINLSS